MRIVRAVLAVAVLASPIPALAQGLPDPAHEEGKDCRSCGKAYAKALQYCLDNLPKAGWCEKVAIGFLLMADGGHPDELETCISSALQTPAMVDRSKWANWYLGFGGIFLAEVYRREPREDVAEALVKTIEAAAKVQEPTGGWFSSLGLAKKANYPGEDHGQLTAMLWSTMLIMKKLGLEVPESTLSKTEGYMQRQCGGGGIGYGTGNPLGDTTGSRGGFASLGLDFTGRRDHKVWTTYSRLLPQCYPRLRRGHHIGGWHMMGVVLGAYTLGPSLFNQLCARWMAPLVSEQRDDGGFYLGDDKASGGEESLLGGDRTSTASLALMILLNGHPKQLKEPAGAPKAKPAAGGRDNPFSRRDQETPGSGE